MRYETIAELRKTANVLRHNVLQMIGTGMTGHLGGSNSAAEIVACLYFYKMKIDRDNPGDKNRDRFLLSKGHAALIQYAALGELGFFPKSEFRSLKSLDAMLQGHPDMTKTPGVEANTGSLGQGLSIACGMALGLRLDKSASRVYVVLGDGELAEGQVWEAAMAAAHYGLDNLVAILDKNGIQATGRVEERFDTGSMAEKWRAFGFHVIEVDGHDVEQLCVALDAAESVRGKPAIIIARTVKGKGVSFAEDTAAYHNRMLTEEEYGAALAEIAGGCGCD